jgi:integrase
MDLLSVSKAMGHSKVDMTQHYAKKDPKKVLQDMKAMFERRMEKGKDKHETAKL